MLIIDDNNDTIILHNLHTPVASKYFWVLDLQLMDFTLTPMSMFEELWCDCVALEIEGFAFSVPAKWRVLVSDEETSTLDVVEAEELSKIPFSVVVYDNERSFAYHKPARVIDASPDEVVVYPSLNRHHMLCHPIAPNRWITIAPNDTYNKYLKNTVLGDIL